MFSADRKLFTLVSILIFTSVILSYSLSSYTTLLFGVNEFHFAIRQAVFAVLGDKTQRYNFIRKTLVKFSYMSLSKKDKGVVILHGEPGTGKTSYIRHLISSVSKKVIFLPPNLAHNITGPELISLLIENPDAILIIEDAENYIRIKMLPQLNDLGYSNYSLIRKSDDSKVGTCGLYDRDGLDGIDIGFGLLPEYEGLGFAYESANRLKKAAFEEFEIEEIKAITSKQNISSQRLLEKLGLEMTGTIKLPNEDEELLLYKIQKNRLQH